MSKVQTRRSISFALADFEAAQELAARLGVPIAQLAAQALRELIARNPERLVITPARQVAAVDPPPPAPVVHPAEPTPDLATILQADLEARVGLLPRGPKKPEPFDLPAARRIVAEVSARDYKPAALDPSDAFDHALAASSVGAGLRNIAENGIDAELVELEQEMADRPDAGEVQVIYDDAPPRAQHNAKRKRR